MCVELDLTKPLVPKFIVEGQVLSVVYESLGLLCSKCGWFGHNKEGCDAFHRKTNEQGMEVEGLGDNKGNEPVSPVEKDLWKTVQRTRKPRRSVMSAPGQQSGSWFSVLNVISGDEERHGGVEKGKEEVNISEVPLGQGEGDKKFHFKAGKSGSKGETSRGSEGLKGRFVKKINHEVRKEKDGRARSGLVVNNKGNLNGTNSVKQHVCGNIEVVPDSNLESHYGTDVNIIGKENLHPGEYRVKRGGNESMEQDGGQFREEEEDPIESLGMSMEGEGAASKGFAAVLRDMKRRYKLNIVVILEPRISGNQATKVIKNWGFKHSVRREAKGFSGGIWILWEMDEIVVDVIVIDEQFIHCKLSLGENVMLFTAIYANPNDQRRHRVWELLNNMAGVINNPWLLAGDFNEIKSPLEQKGGGSKWYEMQKIQ
ncbi:hypothetical protein K1719_044919 [Acacia pycnantha]|nr:hypothetical protein K1719_044919 [Acacia pycnantha]